MTFKTFQAVLHPDGTVGLSSAELPDHPIPVLITLLEPHEDDSLVNLGDYHSKLAEYEDQLAQGDIQWQ